MSPQDQQPPIPSQQPQQPYPPQTPQPQYPPQQPYPPQQMQYGYPLVPPPPPKRNNCLIFGIIGGVVLFLVLCGIGALTYTSLTGKAVSTTFERIATALVATEVSAPPTHAETRKPTATIVLETVATPTLVAQTAPTATQAEPGDSSTITLAQLAAKRNELTDAQWPEYEKSVIGKTMSDKGIVTDVSLEIFGDIPQINVDTDKATELIETRDYLVNIPQEGDDQISKGEEVTFSGTIASLDCFFSICTPTLDNSTYDITGNKQPPKAYPTQTEVHYADFEAKRKELTELQWRNYADSVVGAKISESGYVYDVQPSFLDDKLYDVQVSTKKLTGELDTYEMLFSVPAADAPKLSKNQAIDFSGDVKDFEICILTTCTVSIENATYTTK